MGCQNLGLNSRKILPPSWISSPTSYLKLIGGKRGRKLVDLLLPRSLNVIRSWILRVWELEWGKEI